MPQHMPRNMSGIAARHGRTGITRRGMVLGAVALAVGAAALPTMPGCKAVPYLINTAVSLCAPLLAAILDRPVDTLPPNYTECGQHTWSVRGAEVKFCLYCSPIATDPVHIRLNCEGPYYPIKLREPRPSAGSDGSLSEGGVHLSKLECDEYILALAQAQADALRSTADATLILPNDRVLPDATHFDGLAVSADNRPVLPDGALEFAAGTAVRVSGDFDQVARYAAETGVRSLEFREGPNAWTVEVNPRFAAAAIFKNGRFVEARFLFTPEE